jgi:hypothetical protein
LDGKHTAHAVLARLLHRTTSLLRDFGHDVS